MSATLSPHWVLNADWVWAVSALAVVYILCARRARRAGHVVTRAQVAFFLSGLGVLLIAFLTTIDTYDNVDFVNHVTQHLIFVFVAAPLVALGAPIPVVTQGAPDGLRRRVLEPLQRSALLAALSDPLAAAALFLVVQAGVFLPPLFNGALNSGPPHVVQHVVLLVTAFLFWRAVAGVDPNVPAVGRRRRIGLTLALVGVTAALGLAGLAADTPLYHLYAIAPKPWGGEEAFDLQRAAGWVQLVAGSALAMGASASIQRLRGRVRIQP